MSVKSYSTRLQIRDSVLNDKFKGNPLRRQIFSHKFQNADANRIRQIAVKKLAVLSSDSPFSVHIVAHKMAKNKFFGVWASGLRHVEFRWWLPTFPGTCCLHIQSRREFYTEDGGSMLPRNFGKHTLRYTLFQLRRTGFKFHHFEKLNSHQYIFQLTEVR
jgi:hypothetical protein